MNKSNRVRPILSVVIPIYCEHACLETMLTEVRNNLEFLDKSYELILVDDGSTDNSWEVISEESKKHTMLRAVRLSRNFGKEAAICAGLDMARGSAVITMDGDLQHPPALIKKMFKLWSDSDIDVVEAVKENRGKESLWKKGQAKFFYTVMEKFSGYDLDRASDFKLMDRKVVDAFLKMGERNIFYRGMSAWLGFNRTKIPFVVPERVGGSSGWSFWSLIKLSISAITSFSSTSLHIVTVLGVLFLLFSIGLGTQTLYKVIIGVAVSGFATVIILQLMIGSLLMICLGIIGEYIARIFEEVKQRPRYNITETIDQVDDENIG